MKKIIIMLVTVLIPLFFVFNTDAQTTIQMKKSGEVFTIPCKVNGLAMEFMLDTGASDVSISLTEAMFMFRHDYLKENDFVGVEKFRLADGSVSEGAIVIFKEMEIGGVKLSNVRASITRELDAPLLLGQSALSKFGKIEIDYANNTLTIRDGSTTASGVASKPVQAKSTGANITDTWQKPVSATPPTVAPTVFESTTYSVQLAAFISRREAEKKAMEVEAKGFNPWIEPPLKSGDYYKIKVGSFATRAEAVEMSSQLKRNGFDTMIIESKR